VDVQYGAPTTSQETKTSKRSISNIEGVVPVNFTYGFGFKLRELSTYSDQKSLPLGKTLHACHMMSGTDAEVCSFNLKFKLDLSNLQ
jgi:hypothetical protein